MKRIALSLLAVLALGAPAKAIVGGPFDNNLFYSPTVEGTFQGTLTAKNISAVMIFGLGTQGGDPNLTSNSTQARFANGGSMVTFVNGKPSYSGVHAVPNGSTRKIAAVITADSGVDVNGFMEAKFDNIYPSITYKGKADLSIDDSGVVETKRARVRGIKTSNNSEIYWLWN